MKYTKNEMNIKEFLAKNKYNIAIVIIMIIGFSVRLIGLGAVPEGLNTDEASIGYDAYSIANYGIDRNGNKLPVFLEAWGSGQNALYAYILIPFIKIFGLSVFTVRLPMALIGCVAIYIMYKLLKLVGGKKLALIGTIFLSICPWHIMKSRWGLESNLFPEMILIAVYFLELYLKKEKKYGLYLCFLFLALSTYSYGTSYFFIPIFVLALLIYLLVKKKVKVSEVFIICAMVGIIVLPILICVIINTFNLPQINLPFMTIPRTLENRVSTVSIFGSKNFIDEMITNLVNSIKLLICQHGTDMYNSFAFYGITYVFSLPFTIIGIFFAFKEKKTTSINIWFIISILMLPIIIEANINRINVIMFVMVYYTIYGLYKLIEEFDSKIITIIVAVVYLISFILFEKYYFTHSSHKYTDFKVDLKEVVEYVSSIDAEAIYVTNSFSEPYIFFLFYSKENPHNFIDTVKHFRNYEFNDIKSYGKYYFYLPNKLFDPITGKRFEEEKNETKKAVIVKFKDEIESDDLQNYNMKDIGKFVILEPK